MAFFLTAFKIFKQVFRIVLFLSAVNLLMYLIYTLPSGKGLSFLKTYVVLSEDVTLPLNETHVRSQLFKWRSSTDLPLCPETSPLLGKLDLYIINFGVFFLIAKSKFLRWMTKTSPKNNLQFPTICRPKHMGMLVG